jgi:hypothetical protein
MLKTERAYKKPPHAYCPPARESLPWALIHTPMTLSTQKKTRLNLGEHCRLVGGLRLLLKPRLTYPSRLGVRGKL